MMAFVPDKPRATRKCGLLLDERESSHPDRVHAEYGTLFIIDDHQRYAFNHASKPVPDTMRLHQIVTQIQKADDISRTP